MLGVIDGAIFQRTVDRPDELAPGMEFKAPPSPPNYKLLLEACIILELMVSRFIYLVSALLQEEDPTVIIK